MRKVFTEILLTQMMPFFAGIVGIGALVMGFLEGRLAWGAKMDPQTIRCADLIQNGVGDNGHIILTDFKLADDFVTEGHSLDKQHWGRAFVPILPTGAARGGDNGEAFRVILKTTDVHDPAAIAALQKQQSIQGTIGYGPEWLDDSTQRLLHKSYPDTDLDSCLFLDQGRRPVSALIWVSCLVVSPFPLVLFGWGCIRHWGHLADLLTGRRCHRGAKTR